MFASGPVKGDGDGENFNIGNLSEMLGHSLGWVCVLCGEFGEFTDIIGLVIHSFY